MELAYTQSSEGCAFGHESSNLSSRSIYTIVDFKEWLIKEAFGSSAWDVIYPARAADYPRAVTTPSTFFWLQHRWEFQTEKTNGHETPLIFQNIDDKEFIKRRYYTIHCKDMPPEKGNCWKPLKTKSNESSLEVLRTDMTKLGMGPDADHPKDLLASDPGRFDGADQNTTPFKPVKQITDFHLPELFGDDGTPPEIVCPDPIEPQWNLDKLFGDKGQPYPLTKCSHNHPVIGSFVEWLKQRSKK